MMIQDLYQKVSEFEAKLSPETASRSQCRAGCSQCCYVDLSVFEVEARNIRNWFTALRPDEQSSLRLKWSEQKAIPGRCEFLRNDQCTIYDARPLICRTQGLAFLYTTGEKALIDVCPLNAEMLEVAGKSEIMNLDLLNLILAKLEQIDGEGIERSRVELSKLREDLGKMFL